MLMSPAKLHFHSPLVGGIIQYKLAGFFFCFFPVVLLVVEIQQECKRAPCLIHWWFTCEAL